MNGQNKILGIDEILGSSVDEINTIVDVGDGGSSTESIVSLLVGGQYSIVG